MNALVKLQKRLADELSPRAQLGLLFLAVIAASILVMDLSAHNGALERQLRTVTTELAGRRAALDQRDWNIVQEAAEAEADAVEGRFWRGATTGLVSAEILGAVETAASLAGLNDARVTVLRSDVLAHDAILFEVEIIARSNGGGFATFLEAITQAEHEIRPSELEWSGRNRPVTIRLLVPAIVDEGTPQ